MLNNIVDNYEQCGQHNMDSAGDATDLNLVKNQSRGNAKKVKCSLSVSARTKADIKGLD